MSEGLRPRSAKLPLFVCVSWASALAISCGSVTVSNSGSVGPLASGGSSASSHVGALGGDSTVTQATGGASSVGTTPAGGAVTTLSSGGATSVSSATVTSAVAVGGVASIGGSSTTGGNMSTSITGPGGGTATVTATSSTGGTLSVGTTLTKGGSASTGGALTGGDLGTTSPSTSGAGGAMGGSSSIGGAPATGGIVATAGGLPGTGGAALSGGASSQSQPVIAIGAGYLHTCAVMQDHTVRCWGEGCEGQFGDGRTLDCLAADSSSDAPLPVSNVSQAMSIATGAFHNCVVLSTGGIQCWGSNVHGELGDGTTSSDNLPVQVTGISTAREVVAGDRHTCALLADGTVRCWGANDMGQLGSGVTASSSSPVTVVVDRSSSPAALSKIESIASSPVADATCAVQVGGAVYCWGDNTYGQLLGSTESKSAVALKAEGIQATAVGVMSGSTCASLQSGTTRCWGRGDYGELGDGLGASSTTAVSAALSTSTLNLGFGYRHACAILANAQHGLQCWGYNLYGQMGDGSDFDNKNAPVDVPGLSQVTRVTAGLGHTCALVASGAVYCWGFDQDGQLGPNGSRNTVNGVGLTPLLVTGY